MVYLYYISCLRYTILAGSPQFQNDTKETNIEVLAELVTALLTELVTALLTELVTALLPVLPKLFPDCP